MHDAALNLVYVDAALIVADKPAGLRAHPAAGADRRDSLASRVQRQYPDASLAHRLDEATSGLILLARGADSLRTMHAAFAARTVGKGYVALVQGHLRTDAGDIDLPLAPVPYANPRQHVDRVRGRPALTRYRVLDRTGTGVDACTRVHLTPLTGRTHQLRVHLAALGHPILGDPLYAPPEHAARYGRLHLHATTLSIIHPTRRVPMQFDSPAPF